MLGMKGFFFPFSFLRCQASKKKRKEKKNCHIIQCERKKKKKIHLLAFSKAVNGISWSSAEDEVQSVVMEIA